MGKAIELANTNLEEKNEKIKNLRDYFIMQIEEKIPNVQLNGHRTKRLPGNINISFKDIDGEALLLNLDMKGICISTGSACASGDINPSHVLLAIGLESSLAMGALRVTLGDENTKEDVDFLIKELVEIVERLRNKK